MFLQTKNKITSKLYSLEVILFCKVFVQSAFCFLLKFMKTHKKNGEAH